MIGKLIKIIIVIAAIYFLMQIPFISEKLNGIKTDILQKRDNVVNEYDRVKDKVTETKQKVDDTVKTVDETVDKVGGAVNKVGETVNKVGDVFGGDKEKTDETPPTDGQTTGTPAP